MNAVQTSDQVRAAFLEVGLVSAEQWDRAAKVNASPESVLQDLQSVPAAWASNIAIMAVTSYHAKLVEFMTREGSLAELPRRLRWGRFLILSELGRGGMGVVFLGWDTEKKRYVALKRIRGAAGREVRDRFQREARLLAKLEHPCIAQFLGHERVSGGDVLVMEYVPGITASRTVRRLRKQGKTLPWETAVDWILQVLGALAHAHERRVVHRDIKPGNMMISGKRGVKLLDMGLAKCLDDPTTGDALTQDGQALGTREYMPPEQWEGRTAITPAADIYALGCTLFFLLTGRPPYLGESSYRQMTQHLTAAIPSVREIRPDVPASVDQVIQRMLAKNPNHRGTAREITWILSRQVAAVRQPAPVRPVVLPREHAEPPSEPCPSSNSRRSGTRNSDTPRAVRPSQSTLHGSSVGELTREFVSELGRFMRGMFRRDTSPKLAFDTDPGRRLREVGGELASTIWGGLSGRRPDAARAAWLVVAGLVLVMGGLIWWC